MLARQAALLLSRARRPASDSHISSFLSGIPGLRAEPQGLQFATAAGARASSTLSDGARQLSLKLFTGQHWSEVRSLATAYKQLSKFRLSALVVSTAGAGYVAGSGPDIDWAGLCWTSLGTMMAAASANTLNQVREVWQDSQMHRTCRRPLPSGRVSRLHAVALAAALGLGSLGVLASQASIPAAATAAATIGLYAGVYTPLKQVSHWNTWVGAVVGALPPLLGWAASTDQLDARAAVLPAILYFWQIPHFFALAWLCRADYARAGFRMLTVLNPSGHRVGGAILRNCLYLLPVGPAAYVAGLAGPAFACTASVATGVFAMTAAVFFKKPGNPAAMAVFRASLLYLPAVMAALLLDRVPVKHSEEAPAFRWSLQRSGQSRVEKDGEEGQDETLGALAPPGPPWPFLPLPTHPMLAVNASQSHPLAKQMTAQ